MCYKFGGESGIRTHGTCEGTHTFQACALNHSAISPFLEEMLTGPFPSNSNQIHMLSLTIKILVFNIFHFNFDFNLLIVFICLFINLLKILNCLSLFANIG